MIAAIIITLLILMGVFLGLCLGIILHLLVCGKINWPIGASWDWRGAALAGSLAIDWIEDGEERLVESKVF